MSISVVPLETSQYDYSDCLSLIKEAFFEREQQHLHYPCMDYSLEEYRSKMQNHQVLVALDSDSGNLLGVTSVAIMGTEHDLFALENHTAVSPKFKGKGVGSQMMSTIIQYAEKHGCQSVIASTAEKAKGAIQFHLKNGFVIFRAESYPDTDYYSVVMRRPLANYSPTGGKWSSPFFCKLRYWNSFIRIHLMKKRDGTYTFGGRIIRYLQNRQFKS